MENPCLTHPSESATALVPTPTTDWVKEAVDAGLRFRAKRFAHRRELPIWLPVPEPTLPVTLESVTRFDSETLRWFRELRKRNWEEFRAVFDVQRDFEADTNEIYRLQ